MQMPFFLLQTIGGPLGYARRGLAAVIALVGLTMLALDKAWEKFGARPLITAVLIAGLAMMGMVMIARGGAATAIQATDSRYGTMATLFWVGVVLLVDWTGWRKVVLVLLMGLCILRSVTRLPDIIQSKTRAQAAVRALQSWTPGRLLLGGAQTSPGQLDADERLIRQWHYSLFRNQ